VPILAHPTPAANHVVESTHRPPCRSSTAKRWPGMSSRFHLLVYLVPAWTHLCLLFSTSVRYRRDSPSLTSITSASEPCIRGHRSTKCTHANERLMVPVRKPGRPLSTCPHQSNRGCACSGVTAAIPRKQSCHCGTNNSAANGNTIKTESPAADVAPLSPTRASPGSFRVQKPGSKPSARKQSYDSTTLERMDANHVNILPAYDATQAKPLTSPTNGGITSISAPAVGLEYVPTPPLAPGDLTFNSVMGFMVYPNLPQPLMPPPNGTKALPHSASHNTNGISKVPIAPVTTSSSNGVSSCCLTTPTTTSAAAPTTSSAKVNGNVSISSEPLTSPTNGVSGKSNGSCCGGGAARESPRIKPDLIPTSDLPPTTGVLMSPFQQPMALNQGFHPAFFPQPTVYTYPPQYGSYLHPLQPAQWRQTMETLGFATFPMEQALDFGPPGPNTPSAMGTTHMCSCGDGCQCVGCAAHPYNEPTQNYVRSAWASMHEDSHGANSSLENTGVNGSASANHSQQPGAEGGASPPAPQTPSDAASGTSEEQALSASDFFFVTYPFGNDPACLGEPASCPCGEDCQCIGCSIHSNAAE
jgi:hypothetical protein